MKIDDRLSHDAFEAEGIRKTLRRLISLLAERVALRLKRRNEHGRDERGDGSADEKD